MSRPGSNTAFEHGNLFTARHYSGVPGLVDRMFAIHAGSRGLDSHQQHLSERFFRSNTPGYSHPVCSELENSGIGVVAAITVSLNVGGLYNCTQNHYKHSENGRMAPGICGHDSVPLSNSGNVDYNGR